MVALGEPNGRSWGGKMVYKVAILRRGNIPMHASVVGNSRAALWRNKAL